MNQNKAGEICHCKKCNYSWRAKVHNVKACPHCKQYDWWLLPVRQRGWDN